MFSKIIHKDKNFAKIINIVIKHFPDVLIKTTVSLDKARSDL